MFPARTMHPDERLPRMIDYAHDHGKIDFYSNAAVGYITINNLEKKNALTKSMCLELKDVAQAADADPDVEVIVLKGAGGNFSAGAAIDEIGKVLFDDCRNDTHVDHLSEADRAIASCRKPTISLVEGFCMGGAWQIAAACDFIIASSDAKLAITPAKIGILYPRPGVEKLVQLVGPARAKYILITARTFTAIQAKSLGLVADVIEADAFVETCAEIIDDISHNSRFSQVNSKTFIDDFMRDPPTARQSWNTSWTQMIDGPDMHNGIRAFKTRQKPTFLRFSDAFYKHAEPAKPGASSCT